MLAKVADITTKYEEKSQYIDEIRKRSAYFCKNRALQNIEILKSYQKKPTGLISRFFSVFQ